MKWPNPWNIGSNSMTMLQLLLFLPRLIKSVIVLSGSSFNNCLLQTYSIFPIDYWIKIKLTARSFRTINSGEGIIPINEESCKEGTHNPWLKQFPINESGNSTHHYNWCFKKFWNHPNNQNVNLWQLTPKNASKSRIFCVICHSPSHFTVKFFGYFQAWSIYHSLIP